MLFTLAACVALYGAAEVLPNGASARGIAPQEAPAVPNALAAEAKPTWIEVNRPIQLFELAGSEFAKLPLTYRARRRPNGIDRQDFLTFGALGPRSPYLSLAVSRVASPAPPPTLLGELDSLAAASGLALTRSQQPSTVQTRFGPFAVADLILARKTRAYACLGFKLQPEAAPVPTAIAPVSIAGLACGTKAKAIDRETLACVLDRMDLVSAGDDAALQNFFVEAERRRGQECVTSPLLAAGSRTTWLDASAALPPLRRLSGRGMMR